MSHTRERSVFVCFWESVSVFQSRFMSHGKSQELSVALGYLLTWIKALKIYQCYLHLFNWRRKKKTSHVDIIGNRPTFCLSCASCHFVFELLLLILASLCGLKLGSLYLEGLLFSHLTMCCNHSNTKGAQSVMVWCQTVTSPSVDHLITCVPSQEFSPHKQVFSYSRPKDGPCPAFVQRFSENHT